MPFSNKNWPTIWGFDLSELSFGAFSSKKMFDRRWHLRRERFSEPFFPFSLPFSAFLR